MSEVSKGYDGKPVFRNFSFEAIKGEKIGIIGNNGKGKSTLLKLLAGIIPPDNGKIELGHQVQIGYFPQNHSEVIDKKSTMTAFDWLKKEEKGFMTRMCVVF